MRILFTFAGGSGHLEPLVPIARVARDAGHAVAFSGRPAMATAVRELGFAMLVTGPAGPEAPAQRAPLLEISAEREEAVLREGFAGRIARERADGVLAVSADWRPDVVVCGELDFGAIVAAERAGLPCAIVLVSATETFVRAEVVAEPLEALRAHHSLPPGTTSRRHLVLSPFPRSLRPLPHRAHAFRANTAVRPPKDATTVYVTLGTVFNLESGDLFERVLAGLRDLPVDVVATVGRNLDPGELGAQRANVRLERHLPQSELLPRCRAVVSHGGSGSVLGALAHGLPSVLLPMGADQPHNAARCEQLGVARVVEAASATPAAVREAVVDVLDDPRYRTAAERIADEIASLPGPEHVVRLLERLAGGDEDGARRRYVPAAGRGAFTGLYDVVLALTMRERRWRPAMVSRIADSTPDGGRIVDVGTGTGTLAIAIAAARPDATVIGVDGDRRVLSLAQRKPGAQRVQWRDGLAGELALDDDSVDAAVMSLLLHHLDPAAKRRALRDVRRALRPGGRLFVADWGRPQDPVMRAAFAVLQLVDGREGTRDHAAGRLAQFIVEAGFATPVVHDRLRTAWGTLEVLEAEPQRASISHDPA